MLEIRVLCLGFMYCALKLSMGQVFRIQCWELKSVLFILYTQCMQLCFLCLINNIKGFQMCVCTEGSLICCFCAKVSMAAQKLTFLPTSNTCPAHWAWYWRDWQPQYQRVLVVSNHYLDRSGCHNAGVPTLCRVPLELCMLSKILTTQPLPISLNI